MVHLTRGTNSCSSGNAKPLKEEVKEGASTANPKSSMNPTEGFTPQCQFPKHPSIKPCRIKLDPKRDIKGQTPMRYSTAGPGSKGQWWSSLTEQAIFQSSLQLVYSLSYFDTTPVSVLAWKPPQHSRWQSVCITNVLKGQPVEVPAGTAAGGTGGAAGTLSWGSSTAISPRLCWRNIPPRKGRISVSSECSQLCSSFWQSFPG